MKRPEDPLEPPGDIDALLRRALRDDLPPEIEARLEAGLGRFAAARQAQRGRWAALCTLLGDALLRSTSWTPARAAAGLASALLVGGGLALHLTGAPGAFAEPLSRVNASLSLRQALEAAETMRCTGFADEALASPSALADRVFRRWIPVRSQADEPGAFVAAFRSPDGETRYELIADPATLLPREIRRSHERGEAGGSGGAELAVCEWFLPPPTGARESGR